MEEINILTSVVEESNIDNDMIMEINCALEALVDWQEFGDSLIEEFGSQWYKDRV